jgi:hypothetical protein
MRGAGMRTLWIMPQGCVYYPVYEAVQRLLAPPIPPAVSGGIPEGGAVPRPGGIPEGGAAPKPGGIPEGGKEARAAVAGASAPRGRAVRTR